MISSYAPYIKSISGIHVVENDKRNENSCVLRQKTYQRTKNTEVWQVLA